MLKRALLTGATGYLGSELVKYLLRQQVQVSIIVRPHSDLSILQNELAHIKVFVDQQDHDALVAFIKAEAPEVAFHLASLFIVEHQPVQVTALIEANVLFSTRLCEAMRAAGVKRLVNTGTSWQHYQNTEYKPVNLYAATKQAFYDILCYYVDAHEFQVINLELFDTYGPLDRRKKLIQILLKHINNPTPLEMSPGDQILDLLHVDDVCEAYHCAAKQLQASYVACFESYMLGTEQPVTLKALVALLQKLAVPRKLLVNFGGRSYRNREVMELWQKGKQLPNWRPRVSLYEGLKNLVGQA